jgi:predicted  nucleic acid-binding Zn-ribbon protein
LHSRNDYQKLNNQLEEVEHSNREEEMKFHDLFEKYEVNHATKEQQLQKLQSQIDKVRYASDKEFGVTSVSYSEV